MNDTGSVKDIDSYIYNDCLIQRLLMVLLRKCIIF